MELKAGTYFWCQCGLSQNQPWCDGSHKGTSFTPVKLELATDKRVILCNCKQTKNMPFCDGSHAEIEE
jgi:CDGSH-type Zn-finger protein